MRSQRNLLRWVTILCVAGPLLQACNHHEHNSGGGVFQSVPIIGSGIIVDELRSVPSFNSVVMKAEADVTLTQSSSHSVRVETDENIIQHVRTSVSGGALIIDSDADYDSAHGVRIFVDLTEVRNLELIGVGKITASSIFSSGEVRATLFGVGSISLSGTADRLSGTNAGLGTINAEQLQTRRSRITISGTGDCRTTATDELEVTISGIGDVYYAGNPPSVHSTITGTGSLIPM